MKVLKSLGLALCFLITPPLSLQSNASAICPHDSAQYVELMTVAKEKGIQAKGYIDETVVDSFIEGYFAKYQAMPAGHNVTSIIIIEQPDTQSSIMIFFKRNGCSTGSAKRPLEDVKNILKAIDLSLA